MLDPFVVVHDNVQNFPGSAVTDKSMHRCRVLGDTGFLSGTVLVLIQ